MDIKLNLDSTDFAVENNSLVLISKTDEVAQRLKLRLRMFRGEWFLDVTRGTPYYDEIFVKGVSLDRIAAAFQREILSVPGVIELQSYQQTLDYLLRVLTITFQVLVTDQEILQITEVISA